MCNMQWEREQDTSSKIKQGWGRTNQRAYAKESRKSVSYNHGSEKKQSAIRWARFKRGMSLCVNTRRKQKQQQSKRIETWHTTTRKPHSHGPLTKRPSAMPTRTRHFYTQHGTIYHQYPQPHSLRVMSIFANNVRLYPRINVHSVDNDRGDDEIMNKWMWRRIERSTSTKPQRPKTKRHQKNLTLTTQPAATFCLWLNMLLRRTSILHKNTKRENILMHFQRSINQWEGSNGMGSYTTLKAQHHSPHR